MFPISDISVISQLKFGIRGKILPIDKQYAEKSENLENIGLC